jgi:hypothetical protein
LKNVCPAHELDWRAERITHRTAQQTAEEATLYRAFLLALR